MEDWKGKRLNFYFYSLRLKDEKHDYRVPTYIFLWKSLGFGQVSSYFELRNSKETRRNLFVFSCLFILFLRGPIKKEKNINIQKTGRILPFLNQSLKQNSVHERLKGNFGERCFATRDTT